MRERPLVRDPRLVRVVLRMCDLLRPLYALVRVD